MGLGHTHFLFPFIKCRSRCVSMQTYFQIANQRYKLYLLTLKEAVLLLASLSLHYLVYQQSVRIQPHCLSVSFYSYILLKDVACTAVMIASSTELTASDKIIQLGYYVSMRLAEKRKIRARTHTQHNTTQANKNLPCL